MNVLKYLQVRENRFHPDLKLHRNSTKLSLNTDFLLEKLQCNWEDDHLTIAIGQSEEETLVEEESPVPAFSTKFCTVPSENHILAMANEEGEVNIMNTKLSGDASYITCLHAHKNSVFDVGWVPQEMSLVSVSGDQTAALWDVNTETKLSCFRGHNGSVKWVDFRPNDKAVFSTGGRDGCIMIWDSRTTRSSSNSDHNPDNIIRNAHSTPMTPILSGKNKKRAIPQPNYNHSITAVLFQDEHTLISSGATDGAVKAWDIRKHYSNHRHSPYPKFIFPYQGTSINKGYCSLVFDSSRRLLFASCLDNVIYLFNCGSYQEKAVATYEGHQTRTFYVKSAISPDDQYLLSGSSDHCAYIWKVSKPGDPFCKLEGHEAEVTAVAWSPESQPKIITCGDDMKFKVWRLSLSEEKRDTTSKPNQGKAVMQNCQSVTQKRKKTNGLRANNVSASTPRKWAKAYRQVMPPLTPEVNKLSVSPLKEMGTRSPSKRQSSSASLDWLISPSVFRVSPNLLPAPCDSPTSTCTQTAFHYGEDGRSQFQTPILNNILSPRKNVDENQRRRPGVSKSLFEDKPVGNRRLCQKENSLLKSPTTNLPNTVNEDKTSPALHQRLVRKSRNECHSDWLTQLSRQKKRLSSCFTTSTTPERIKCSKQSPRPKNNKSPRSRTSKRHTLLQAKENSSTNIKTHEISHYFSPSNKR